MTKEQVVKTVKRLGKASVTDIVANLKDKSVSESEDKYKYTHDTIVK